MSNRHFISCYIHFLFNIVKFLLSHTIPRVIFYYYRIFSKTYEANDVQKKKNEISLKNSYMIPYIICYDFKLSFNIPFYVRLIRLSFHWL